MRKFYQLKDYMISFFTYNKGRVPIATVPARKFLWLKTNELGLANTEHLGAT